jgi:hypothetical protein
LADLARAVAQEHQEYLDSLEGKTSNDQHDWWWNKSPPTRNG